MAVQLEEVLNTLGQVIVKDIKNNLRAKGKRATGKLISGLKAQALGNELIIKSIGAEKYQSIVDLGRKPGKGVPPKNLLEWIKIKNIRPNKARNVKTERDLLFVINRKIKNQGIQGIEYTRAALNKFGPIIGDSIGLKYQEELDRIIKELKPFL
tara:strand:+ start:41 stop:502 length:462 start_codon:yes stop_codon:yes gene_type:complete